MIGTMNRYIVATVVGCLFTFASYAQVAKRVEVTKAYAPEIAESKKMDVVPNMVDTITLRPEIDYSITPRSFASSLGTHNFKPASVIYWEYQRKYPFYLKAGVGYPLNTVADFYATTHRADVGYLTAYVNHYGEYGKLRYSNYVDGKLQNASVLNRSHNMVNKAGVTGGKYFGRYTLAGDIYYRMDMYDRYPLDKALCDRRRIDFEDINLALSFGDSFSDLSRFNFKVYALMDYYHDKSKNLVAEDQYQQMNVAAGVDVAREITRRSSFSLNLDYRGVFGLKSLKGYNNSIATVALMYDYRSEGLIDLKVGAKVSYDRNAADVVKSNRWHAFPYLTLNFDITRKGTFVPYVEIDGELQNNSYYSLVRQNPYVAILGKDRGALQADIALPNTEVYNVRVGISGHTNNNKFAYRLYANFSAMTNALYWYNVNQLFFGVQSARMNVWSLCANLEYKPISQLLFSAQVKGSLYSNFAEVRNPLPPIEAEIKARYTHKKFTIGISANLYGTTKWTFVNDDTLLGVESNASANTPTYATVTMPASVDLKLYADWRVGKEWTIFVEGNNLLNMPMYRWAFYREMGVSFTAGVKVQF